MTAYVTYNYAELLLLIRQDDEQAFDIFYNRHWEYLFDTAVYILHDANAAKDIVQDVFVWLWQHRADTVIQSPKAYLNAAVKFKVANYIRSGNTKEKFYSNLSGLHSSSEPTPDDIAEIKELRLLIQQAIASLPEKCREIYVLKKENALTNQQIAERLSISIKTVENQITLANKKIKQFIGPYLLLIALSGTLH